MADTTINGLRVPDEYTLKVPVKPYTGHNSSNESGDLMGNSTHNSIDLKIGDVYVSSLGLTLAAKQTGTFTCKPGFIYPVDTTTNEVIGIIPANWPLGARVTFIDVSGMWDNNKFILRSTLKIKGETEDKEYTGKYQSESLIYADSQRGIIPFGGGSTENGAGGPSGTSEGSFEKLEKNTDLVSGGRYFSKVELTNTLPTAEKNGETILYINYVASGKITGNMVSPEGVNLTELPLNELKDFSIRFIWDMALGRWMYVLSDISFSKPLNIILYDTPGTFTYKPPFGIKALAFIIVGGGGGGGCAGGLNPGYYPASGGGGGAYCGSVVQAADVLEEYTITVGNAGNGGTIFNNGQDGGLSSVSDVAVANGGKGGRRGSPSPTSTRGAAGGIAVGGDVALNGGSSPGTSNPYGHFSGGGNAPDVDSHLPPGLDGPATTLIKTTTPVSRTGSGATAGNTPPRAGSYGGGASGTQHLSTKVAGARGGNGYVIVLEM